MNGELFPAKAVRQLSPRLKWVKEHDVRTLHRKVHDGSKRWFAWVDGVGPGQGEGETEEEACRDLGVKAGIKLWNELP